MCELVIELREFLAEHVYTCFFTNFYFEHAGVRLNDYSELSEIDLIANPRLIMKPERYDEKSARTHIKKFVDILEKPPVLTMAAKSLQEATEETQTRSRSASAASPRHSKPGEEAKEAPAEEAKGEAAAEEDDERMQSYKQFYDVIRAHQEDEIPGLSRKDEQSSSSEKAAVAVGELLSGSIFKSDLNKLKHVACVDSIEFSSFNPVGAERKMAGDLFYLVVRTLENPHVDHCITCSVNGFFKNDSSEKSAFSPGPSQRASPCFSYTLAGCLAQLSPAFQRNLQTYLGSILRTEPYFITPIATPVDSWLARAEGQVRVANFEGVKETICPLHGYDPSIMRDWNEEFQTIKAIPSASFLQRLQKDRAFFKVYSDFLEAAVKGAEAIIEGKLMALNPNEPTRQHVYVFNSIFFSYAVDTPLSNADLSSSENSQSYTQANNDFKGLLQMQALDFAELHHLATCLVDFKGSRLICQSIIPGILNNADLASLSEYGCLDEKSNVVATPQFHEKMLKVADGLHLSVSKVKDAASGKSLDVAGSVELKGIKGSDRRNYVVDLQGLVPRDANYKGDDHHTCLVRHELVAKYQHACNLEYAQKHIKDFALKLDADRVASEPKPEEGQELSEEQKKDIARRKQEDNIKKVTEVERLIAEAPKQTFNANVFKSSITLDMTPGEIKEAEAQVEKLATFLTETAIPGLVTDFKQQEGIPVDSESLEDFMHKRGVNMRYLGKVLEALAAKAPADGDSAQTMAAL